MNNKSMISLFFTACLLMGCGNEATTGNRTPVINVKTVSPVVMNSVTTRTFPGVVKAASVINVGFKTAGQISRIAVTEGGFVREGAVIAELDKKDYLLQLEATQIQYNQLKTEVERLEMLYKRNSLPVNDYEKATAGLEALGVMLQAHTNVVENTVLKSPVSGYVQSVNFARSEMVNAGMTVVTLIDVSSVNVETELPAALFLRLDDFIEYSCRSGNEEIPLTFTGINRKSNSSQLHKMTFVPKSPQTRLAPGMNVEIHISINEKTEGRSFSLPAKIGRFFSLLDMGLSQKSDSPLLFLQKSLFF